MAGGGREVGVQGRGPWQFFTVLPRNVTDSPTLSWDTGLSCLVDSSGVSFFLNMFDIKLLGAGPCLVGSS